MHNQIGVTFEPKVIGVNNGISQVEFDRNKLLNEKGEYHNFYEYFNDFSFWQRQDDAFNYFAPDMICKKLKKALLTDIMGYGPKIMAFSWLISDDFYKILKNFNIGKHKFFDVKIDNCNMKYYFLLKKSILVSEFNFDETVISTGQKILDNYKEHSFRNYEEFFEFSKQNPLLEFRSIAVDRIYEGEDIVFTQAGGNFFSEELIKNFIGMRLTGLREYKNCKIDFV